jgi:hypothetical protein
VALTHHCKELAELPTYRKESLVKDRLHPTKKVLSKCARQKLKKGRASNSGTQCMKYTGYAGKPKQGETPAKTSKRRRPEDGTSKEIIRPPKKPRDFRGPGTYEALTNVNIAIFRET